MRVQDFAGEFADVTRARNRGLRVTAVAYHYYVIVAHKVLTGSQIFYLHSPAVRLAFHLFDHVLEFDVPVGIAVLRVAFQVVENLAVADELLAILRTPVRKLHHVQWNIGSTAM